MLRLCGAFSWAVTFAWDKSGSLANYYASTILIVKPGSFSRWIAWAVSHLITFTESLRGTLPDTSPSI